MREAILLHEMSPEDLDNIIKREITQMREEVEYPKKRSDCMEYLGIADLRTFNRRREQLGVVAAGQIGKEPAYYLSHFFEPNKLKAS